MHDLNFSISNNVCYITYEYFDQTSAPVNRVVKNDNGTRSWLPASSNFMSGQILGIALAVDGTTPYVAYKDIGTIPNHTGILKKSDGTQWIAQGEVFSSSSPESLTLAVRNSLVYVAFIEYNNSTSASTLKVMRYIP